MKSFYSLMTIFSFLILLTLSCEDMVWDNPNDANNTLDQEAQLDPLIGTWEMVSVAYNATDGFAFNIYADSDNYETLRIYENGTYSWAGDWNNLVVFSRSGTWSSTSNEFAIVTDGDSYIHTYSISGSRLTLSLTEQTYSTVEVLEKQ